MRFQHWMMLLLWMWKRRRRSCVVTVQTKIHAAVDDVDVGSMIVECNAVIVLEISRKFFYCVAIGFGKKLVLEPSSLLLFHCSLLGE